MILVWLSCNREPVLKERDMGRERFFWFFAVLFLVWFAGMRMRYNDTVTYLNGFANPGYTPNLATFFRTTDYNLSKYWGYSLVKSFLKTIGMDSHMILLSFTVFYILVYLWFIRKYASDYLPIALFLFMADGYVMLLAALKQVTATAFALIAVDALLNRKKVRFALWMFVAFTFHPYVVVLLAAALFIGAKPWSGRTWLFVLVMGILGLGMEYTANILASFNDVYDTSSILDHTMNPIRFAVSLVPVLISYLYRNVLFEDSSKAEDLFANLTVCRTMFYFWALFGNPIVFARISNYFDVFNTLFLAWAIHKLCMKKETADTGAFLKLGMYIGFIGFSFFLNVLGYDFARQTEHISLSQLASSFSQWMGVLFGG